MCGTEALRVSLIVVVRPDCRVHTSPMWIAVCANKDCRWDHVASSKETAMFYGHAHHFEHLRVWDATHRVSVVEIPGEPPLKRSEHTHTQHPAPVAAASASLVHRAPRLIPAVRDSLILPKDCPPAVSDWPTTRSDLWW